MYTQAVAGEQLLKKEKSTLGLPWRLLTLSFIVFGLTLGIYLGIIFGYVPYLNSQLSKIDKDLKTTTGMITVDKEKTFLTIYSQVNNIQKVLNSRHSTVNFLDFLEKNTLKSVYFRNISLEYKTNVVKMEGIAPTDEAIAQQMEIFRKSDIITDVILDAVHQSESKESPGLGFSIKLTLK